MKSPRAIVEAVAREPELVVSPYHWPDLDGVATSVALRQALAACGARTVHILLAETPQADAMWALDRFDLGHATEHCVPPGAAIIVDTSEVSDIPVPLRERPIVANIDHHVYAPRRPIAAKHVHRQACGACASIACSILEQMGLALSENTCILLHCAIQLNSFLLQSTETAPIDRRACAYLEGRRVRALDEAFQSLLAYKLALAEADLIGCVLRDLPSAPYATRHGTSVIAQLEVPDALRLLLHHQDELRAAMAAERDRQRASAYICLFRCFTTATAYLVADRLDPVSHALRGAALDILVKDEIMRIRPPLSRKALVQLLQAVR